MAVFPSSFLNPLLAPGVPHSACREIGILLELRELGHPNVVSMLDVQIDVEERQLGLILEWAEFDLSSIIQHHRDRNQALPYQMVRGIMWQLLDATDFVHSHWILHRDIKVSRFLFFCCSAHLPSLSSLKMFSLRATVLLSLLILVWLAFFVLRRSLCMKWIVL